MVLIYLNVDKLHRLDELESDVPKSPPKDCNGRWDAVDILKSSPQVYAQTRTVLSPGLILGIINAEQERMSFFEKTVYDGGGLGPGQMYEPAHTDVVSTFPNEIQDFIRRVNTCLTSQGNGAIELHANWSDDVKDEKLSVFFIAAYLALCINRSHKPGRSAEEALRYGIVRYHGAMEKITRAQRLAAPRPFESNQVISWNTVATYIENSGTGEMRDVLDYVGDVLRSR